MSVEFALVERLLDGWRFQLGDDQVAFRNHVYRLIHYTRLIYPAISEDEHHLLQVAATFHQVSIWLDGSTDYLQPSAERAGAWLARHSELCRRGLEREQAILNGIIYCQNRLRPLSGSGFDLAEAFRKANWMEMFAGHLRFSQDKAAIRAIKSAYPGAGYHYRFTRLVMQRLRVDPLAPLPMMRG
mgnify:CR=1 FL=1